MIQLKKRYKKLTKYATIVWNTRTSRGKQEFQLGAIKYVIFQRKRQYAVKNQWWLSGHLLVMIPVEPTISTDIISYLRLSIKTKLPPVGAIYYKLLFYKWLCFNTVIISTPLFFHNT